MSQAITYIDNCPVVFSSTSVDEPTSCDFDKRVMYQLANQSDYLSFGFFGSQCGSEESVCTDFAESCIATAFGSFLVGWNYYSNTFGNYLYHSATQTPLYYQPTLTGLYKIVFRVGVGTSNEDTGYSTGTTLLGSLTISKGYYNSGTWTISDTDNVFTTPGEKTIYVEFSSTYNTLLFSPSSDFNGTISSLSIVKINTDYGLAILNSSNALSYISSSNPFSYKKDWFRIKQQWSEFGLSDGCYKVAVIDYCTIGSTVTNKITNGTFTGSSAGWTLGAGWAYGSNKVTHTAGSANTVKQSLAFTVGRTYMYKFTISGKTVGSMNCWIVNTAIPIGTVTESVTATGSNTTAYKYFTATATAGDITFTPSTDFDGSIDDVYLWDITEYLTANPKVSNYFSLATSHPCTKRFVYYNEESAFGTPFSYLSSIGDFSYEMRLECEIRNSRYPEDQKRFRNSAGSNEIVYFSSQKAWELLIGQQPEYMHDAIRLMKGSDVMYIDSVQYVCSDDEYEPEWSTKPTLRFAPSRLTISKKIDNNINSKC